MRRGLRMIRQSGKGDQREEGREEGKLLGKVTVIRRAHRVISHKAAEACTSPSPKLSVKYILPPPVSTSIPPPLSLPLFFSSFTPSRICLRQTTIFIFYVLISFLFYFVTNLSHFFPLDFHPSMFFWLIYFLTSFLILCLSHQGEFWAVQFCACREA